MNANEYQQLAMRTNDGNTTYLCPTWLTITWMTPALM